MGLPLCMRNEYRSLNVTDCNKNIVKYKEFSKLFPVSIRLLSNKPLGYSRFHKKREIISINDSNKIVAFCCYGVTKIKTSNCPIVRN